MRIAILAWGSLVWDKEHEAAEAFDEQHGSWSDDGPMLMIELSRISKVSRPGVMTYVIDKDGSACRVKWALSERMTCSESIDDLKKREKATSKGSIGFKNLKTNERCGRDESSLKVIENWARAKEIDAAIWTDLRPNFSEETGRECSTQAVLEHVKKSADARRKTIEYVIRAPIRTPIATALLSTFCPKE